MKFNIDRVLDNLPEVEHPKKKIAFKEKLMWTGAALIIYYILALIPLYGLDPNYQARFETLSILLAAQFGSIISLGIGPIVTASIILQLLVGADVLKIDIKTHKGRKTFQGLQKLLSIIFIIGENALYVMSGALPAASPEFIWIIIIQLIVGGLLVMFLDEVVSKWGIGSGISLFIAAGVCRQVFINALNPLPDPVNPTLSSGSLIKSIQLALQGIPQAALWPIIAVIATVVVFILSVYIQAVKVEIPLSFGRFRGFSFRWPLKFVYTSNMPVIFTAALIASMQFWGLSLFRMGIPILGTYEQINVGGQLQEVPKDGLVKYLNPPELRDIVTQGLLPEYSTSIIVYSLFMIIGAILFSILWINVGGQSAGDVADQILSSGLRIPGFRADKRIFERLLNRYIMPLTILGGATVGALAVLADLLGALSRGTGILLTVMIIYQLYEEVYRKHYDELPEGLKKILKK